MSILENFETIQFDVAYSNGLIEVASPPPWGAPHPDGSIDLHMRLTPSNARRLATTLVEVADDVEQRQSPAN